MLNTNLKPTFKQLHFTSDKFNEPQQERIRMVHMKVKLERLEYGRFSQHHLLLIKKAIRKFKILSMHT